MLWLLTAAVTFLFAPATTSQTGPDRALSVVRLVNTAEAYAHHDQGKYDSLAGLISSGALKKAGGMSDDFSSTLGQSDPRDGGLLAGFDFTLVVSSDGSAYKVSLVPQKERCGMAYFSDERGLIYTGKAIGCSS